MVGLRNRAVLEIDLQDDSGATHTCVFELQEDLQEDGEVAKRFVMGNRGQYITEIWDISADAVGAEDLTTGGRNMRGYHVDGGAGDFVQRLTARAGDKDMRWGDGSSDPDDPADITKYDATGCDRTAQKQVFEWVISQAKTDSISPARLHIGEHTNGDYSAEAGVYGQPLAVAIREASATKDPDDPSAFEVTIECVWTALAPEAALDEAQQIIDDIAGVIPET